MKRTFETVFVAALAVVVAGCAKRQEEAAEKPEKVLAVVTQKIGNEPFERRITVQGSLEAEESATVAARMAGTIDGVFVDVGDTVKKGETKLFQIDSVELESRVLISERGVDTAKAQLLVAEASLKSVQATQKKAALDADRFGRLHAENRVSDNEFEQVNVQKESADAQVAIAEASISLAKEQIASAEAALAIARRNLSDATVFAPIDGVVNARLMEPGERASPGDAVMKITGAGRVKAIAYLPSEYYKNVEVGVTEFRLYVDGEDRGMQKVSAKTPEVDMRLRTFGIRAMLDGADGIVPGKMGTFEVIFEAKEGLSVPDSAVLNRRSSQIVFVNVDGVARAKVIRAGLRTDGRTEILEGLTAGDEVIVQGQTQLYDGHKVKISGSDSGTAKTE